MLIHLHHALRTSGDKAQPGVIQVAPEQKGRTACADSVPIGVAGSDRQVFLQVFKALAGPKDDPIQEALRHEDRLLPVELEIDLDDGTHCVSLLSMPMRGPSGEGLSAGVQNCSPVDQVPGSSVGTTSYGAPYAEAQNRRELFA